MTATRLTRYAHPTTGVIPGFIPGIHRAEGKRSLFVARWIPGTSPGMTLLGQRAMTAHAFKSATLTPARLTQSGPWFPAIGKGRGLEIAAALTAMGLLVLNAALPEDRNDAGRAALHGAPAVFAAAPETVFGAYLGAPYHYPSDFHLKHGSKTDLTIKDVEWFTHPFNNPLYYGARIQRWMAGGVFGTMIDFTHSKAYAPFKDEKTFQGTLDGKPLPDKAKVEDYFDRLEYSHGHNMLTFNGLMRVARFGPIWPYAGLGAGISLPHSEIHSLADPARTYEYQYAGPVAQALFGLEFRLKTGSVFIEYKFTTADYLSPITNRDGNWLPFDMWHQFSRWWSGEEPPGGWASTRLTSHQVIGGFYVRFAPQAAAQ
jgi:lipid A oxidase